MGHGLRRWLGDFHWRRAPNWSRLRHSVDFLNGIVVARLSRSAAVVRTSCEESPSFRLRPEHHEERVRVTIDLQLRLRPRLVKTWAASSDDCEVLDVLLTLRHFARRWGSFGNVLLKLVELHCHQFLKRLERSLLFILEGLLTHVLGTLVSRSIEFFETLLESNHHGVLLCFPPYIK